MAEESRKREFVIEADEKSPVTLQDEPKYFSDIKPKKRHIVDIIYEDTGEVAQTRKGDRCKLILKTTIYNDGTTVDTTVGEENEGYQHFLKTGIAIPSQSNEPTLVRKRSDKVQAALDKAKKTASAKQPAKKAAKPKE